jgi:hypothetical protein
VHIADREGFDSHESALKFEEQLGTYITFEKNAAGKRCATPIVPADVHIVRQGKRACKGIEH